MAQKATVFKANLNVADMDRHYYETHTLTIARHPSETDERMMVRLLAFALHAHEHLEFGRGLSSDDEADLWKKDLTGTIDLWIDVGIPDEKLIRKACGRAAEVVVYCYGGRVAEMWYEQNSTLFAKQKNLRIVNLSEESTQQLKGFAQRNMDVQCTVQDGELLFSNDSASIQIAPQVLKQAQAS